MVMKWLGHRWFRMVHGSNLVYNTCWEDPRLDRVALELTPQDDVLVITSAGCNALDYALESPRHVYAVDMNPRQNALLELKLAGYRTLDYDDFFQLFGRGRHTKWRELYQDCLRGALPDEARKFWDRRFKFFSGAGWKDSFYFHGTSGTFARLINTYIDRIAKVRPGIDTLLAAKNVDEQRNIYDSLRSKFWTPFIKWAVARDTTLSMLGVPRAQREQVDRYYKGGISGFIEDSVDTVFSKLPLHDNYFWRVYLTGEYSQDCCPEYLKKENFAKLKAEGAAKVTTHTQSVLDFLKGHPGKISRYVLLDHMDWLYTFLYPVLQQEWEAIVDRAAPHARILWRSGGLRTEFVDSLPIKVGGNRHCQVGELLKYHPELAADLHTRDRVHTYGSFYIADLRA